jgi:hypothetical protein
MARITAEHLWEIARSGQRKLKAPERRRVLRYLDEIGEKKISTIDLARAFQVSEQQVRSDKRQVIETYVGGLTPKYAMLFVAKHFKDVDDLIAVARRGLDETESGSSSEAKYLEVMLKLAEHKWDSLQEVGLVRKELADMNADEEKWVATVSEEGECGVHKEESKSE